MNQLLQGGMLCLMLAVCHFLPSLVQKDVTHWKVTWGQCSTHHVQETIRSNEHCVFAFPEVKKKKPHRLFLALNDFSHPPRGITALPLF